MIWEGKMQGNAGWRTVGLAFLLMLFSPMLLVLPAAAQQGASIVRDSGYVLNIDVNRGILLRLDRDAANIFIVSTTIADVDVKSPRLLYLFGRSIGETTIYAIDEDEEVIYSALIKVVQNLDEVRASLDALLPNASLQVKVLNRTVVLTGTADSPEEVETAERFLQGALGQGQTLINRVKIATPIQVNLRVKFAEVGSGVLKQLGFRQSATLSTGNVAFDFLALGGAGTTAGGPTGSGFLGLFAGDRFNLGLAIDALETQGYLSILAEPNLTALSGETASFLAGGEFPIPVSNNFNSTVVFREFGVKLSFTPTVLSENKIHLRVMPEVSQLTNTGATTSGGIAIPGLSTRKAETTVELASGQSFAIAGLLQSTIIQDKSKFPGLGDLPIIGPLFRSDQFRRDETELVIVVTPYIVRPIDNRQLVLPTDGIQTPSDISRYLQSGTLTGQARPGARFQKSGPGKALRGGAGFRLKR